MMQAMLLSSPKRLCSLSVFVCTLQGETMGVGGMEEEPEPKKDTIL